MSDTTTDRKKAHAEEAVRDIFIRLYLPWTPHEEGAKVRYLERWIKDFQDFLRDHRSQDVVSMEVHRDTVTTCSACFEELEIVPPDEETPYPWCAYCGAEIVEQEPTP